MASKGEQRVNIAFVCTVCKAQNYITEKNKINEQGTKLAFNKYCKHCKKTTPHKETDKLGKNK